MILYKIGHKIQLDVKIRQTKCIKTKLGRITGGSVRAKKFKTLIAGEKAKLLGQAVVVAQLAEQLLPTFRY